MSSELKYEDYTVAWICALPFEATAAMFMLDELHDGEFPWRSGQESIYTVGSLNGHNVVIAVCQRESMLLAPLLGLSANYDYAFQTSVSV